MATDSAIGIVYFGADASWQALQGIGFRRRNTCLLREFARHPGIGKLVVVIPTTRRRAYLQPSWWRLLLGLRRPERVQDVLVFAFLPGQRWIPAIGQLNQHLARWLVRRALTGYGQSNTIQWCYWPEGFRFAAKLRLPGARVFDADHNIVDDPNQSAGPPEEVTKLMLECAKNAQLIVAGSRSMLTWLIQRGASRTAYLRNGADPTRFLRSPETPQEEPKSLNPRIGYLGTMSEWVRGELLSELAFKCPHWKFVLGGPRYGKDPIPGIERFPNVEWVGEVHANDVPAFLRSLDVGLAIYRQEPWLDGDSMKIFDYLSAGLPVVSTPFHPSLMTDFAELLEIAEDADGFRQAIKKLLTQTAAERDYWNKRRMEFLADNTWELRGAQAVHLLRNCRTV